MMCLFVCVFQLVTIVNELVIIFNIYAFFCLLVGAIYKQEQIAEDMY
jgi:hypothetical protein